MIKAILFDVDGVLITGKYKYFSDRFSKEHGVPNDMIMKFFRDDFPACAIGKADLKEALAKYLPEWNWRGTVDNFLEYWFSGENEKNERLMKFIEELRKRGIKCYLSTGQEKYRMEFLRKILQSENNFDGEFVSNEIGFSKKEKEFWREVMKKLSDYRPEEILLVDNDQKVLEIAKEFGIEGRVFEGLEKFEKMVLKEISLIREKINQ